MEIILMLLVMVVCFAAGWIGREIAASRRIDRMMGGLQNEISETINKEMQNLIPITIEYDNDTFFVYSNEDHTFMAQGTSLKELEKNLEKRYPGKRFAARPENLKEVGFNQ